VVLPTAEAVSSAAVHKADHPSPLKKVLLSVPEFPGTRPLIPPMYVAPKSIPWVIKWPPPAASGLINILNQSVEPVTACKKGLIVLY